ncbi:hypothetical protein C8J56DRAFT_1033413, partial [Mycena floridula]
MLGPSRSRPFSHWPDRPPELGKALPASSCNYRNVRRLPSLHRLTKLQPGHSFGFSLSDRAVHRPYNGLRPYNRRVKTGTVLANPSVDWSRKSSNGTGPVEKRPSDGRRVLNWKKTSVSSYSDPKKTETATSGLYLIQLPVDPSSNLSLVSTSRISREDGDERRQEMWRRCHFGTIPLKKGPPTTFSQPSDRENVSQTMLIESYQGETRLDGRHGRFSTGKNESSRTVTRTVEKVKKSPTGRDTGTVRRARITVYGRA